MARLTYTVEFASKSRLKNSHGQTARKSRENRGQTHFLVTTLPTDSVGEAELFIMTWIYGVLSEAMKLRSRRGRMVAVAVVVLSVIVALIFLGRIQLPSLQSRSSSRPPIDIDPASVAEIDVDLSLTALATGTYPDRPSKAIVLRNGGVVAVISYLKGTFVCKPPTTKSIVGFGDLTLHLKDGRKVRVDVNTSQSTSLFGRKTFELMFVIRGPSEGQEVWSVGGTVSGTVEETVEELFKIIRAEE